MIPQSFFFLQFHLAQHWLAKFCAHARSPARVDFFMLSKLIAKCFGEWLTLIFGVP